MKLRVPIEEVREGDRINGKKVVEVLHRLHAQYVRLVLEGGRVYTIAGRRWRWKWYNCIPLILLGWVWGAVVAAIPWLWLLKGVVE